MNWIFVAISGAFFQNLRSTLQKKLNQKVSTVASTYVRFAFALPFGAILFFLYFREISIIPEILNQKKFIFNIFLASIFQIFFTFVLLYLFRFANFVVGTSLSKTEVIQVAIFEYLIIGDKLNKFGITGIIVSTIGVIILSIKDLGLFLKNLFSKTTLVGLIAGLFLGLSVVYFRAAALTLENFEDVVIDSTKALELDYSDKDAFVNRGIANLSLNKFDDAIQDATEAIYLDKYDKGYYIRGLAKYRKRDFNKAILDFSNAINYRSGYSKHCLFFRAVARARNNNYEDALDDFKSFIGKNEMRRIKLFKDNLGRNKDILNDIPNEMISLIRLNIGNYF